MMRDLEDLENDVKVLTESVDQMGRHLTFLLERVEKLEKATGQETRVTVTYDPTCGGIHKPFDEIDWPDHCHVRRCPAAIGTTRYDDT